MCDFQLESGYLHILLRFWIIYKLPVCVGFLWHHASRKRGLLPCDRQVSTSAGAPLASIDTWGWGTSFYCWVGVGVLVTPLTTQDRRALVTAVRDESPHSLLGLLWLHPGSTLGTSVQPGKEGSPGSPHGLCSCGWGWGWGYSFFYDVWLE